MSDLPRSRGFTDTYNYPRFGMLLPVEPIMESDDERAARRRADTRWEEFILTLVERGPEAALASWHETRRTM